MAINWDLRNYTKEQFKEAWLASESISQCAQKLGISKTSSTTHNTAKLLGLTTDHMNPLARSSIGFASNRRKLEDILVYGEQESTYNLKIRLINSNLLEEACQTCKRTEWNENKIPLELDHIDGDRLNNTLLNLRLLCPNCHAQTETYRGKNIKEWYKGVLRRTAKYCPICNIKLYRNSIACKKHWQIVKSNKDLGVVAQPVRAANS